MRVSTEFRIGGYVFIALGAGSAIFDFSNQVGRLFLFACAFQCFIAAALLREFGK